MSFSSVLDPAIWDAREGFGTSDMGYLAEHSRAVPGRSPGGSGRVIM